MAAPSTPFPLQLDTIKYGQEEIYRLHDDLFSEGVVAAGDGAVTQFGGGAMRANVAAGEAYVTYETPYGGKRKLRWTATESGPVGSPTTGDNWLSTFTTAHATLPRIDRVVATVQDASLDATGQRRQVFQVIAGTATSGADLTNLTGATAVPANSILLANVLVRAAATTILTADIDTSNTVRQLSRAGGGRLQADPPCARVFHNANQSIATATLTALAFNQERFDTDTIHDVSTNNTRLTCKTAGKYLIVAGAHWAANPVIGTIRLRLNGATAIAEDTVVGDYRHMALSTIYDLAVSDYVELIVQQQSGGAVNIDVVGNTSPEFSMARLGT